MRTIESLWQTTRTFFPLFLRQVELNRARSIAVVGAADGKFVLPLAQAGAHVTAFECDRQAVEDLRLRLDTERLAEHVEVVTADVLDLLDFERHDAVWTSCSWHYSRNHRRPLKHFIDVLDRLCTPHGLLGAEYMMPIDPHHELIEHYLPEGRIRTYLPDWSPVWETYTPIFDEAPHPGQPEPHRHRMGFFLGRRQTASTEIRY